MKKQWRSLGEYAGAPEPENSHNDEIRHKEEVIDLLSGSHTDGQANRRDFLKLLGFSFASAALVKSCEKPVHKAIPYLIKPEEVVPGKASYYASSFFDGSEYGSILVKVRDGRPVKIEANKLSPVTGGGTSARVQASLLALYDEARYKEPVRRGKSLSWEDADNQIMEALAEAGEGRSVLVTPTVISPSTEALIREFLQANPDMDWLCYDETDLSAIREAHRHLLGEALIPFYRFDKAEVILSFDADFLGTWLMPVEFAHGYARGRDLTAGRTSMSHHIQVEAGLSVTGSNADYRIPASPEAQEALLRGLYGRIAEATGNDVSFDYGNSGEGKDLAKELLGHKGSSIVVCGSNRPVMQDLVAGINFMLGNYGHTLDVERSVRLKNGNREISAALTGELANGRISKVVFWNVNPVYSHPLGEKIAEGIGKAMLSVYVGSSWNETADCCEWIIPDNHYLESWGDAEPLSGSYSLQQPCISPLYNTRAFQETLLAWLGKKPDYHAFLMGYWEERLYPGISAGSFRNWWTDTLQKGVFEKEKGTKLPQMSLPQISMKQATSEGTFTLTLYSSVGLNDGRHANNPWLMELPDPVSLVCWDNYLAVSPSDAVKMDLKADDVVEMDGLEIPLLIQPGQAPGTVSLALGYGRSVAGKVAEGVGVNAYRFVGEEDGHRVYQRSGIKLTKTGKNYQLAMTQTQHSMEGRPIVRNTTLGEYLEDPSAGNHAHLEAEAQHQTLYPDVKFDGFHWGLVVDLNKCVSCNNCIVSCISENNIATVGRDEVRNRRIMHWLRIDRYYQGEPDNPKVLRQPVMCQHCDNAPCENVCPVSATMHSNEGLNQVAYVRCIGTKYCINNCPYRVRRFNWFRYVKNDKFNYHLNSDTSRLVLNPDVTVRERGVVEKCTFCVQRIQEKKLEAKLENRELRDGDIQPACVQSCPTGALIFGNTNDPESRVSRLLKEDRNYFLLEQLHTLPSVGYLTRVSNREPDTHSGTEEIHA